LTGIGESQVLTYGIFTAEVVIPYDDIKFDAVLGTTFLGSVDKRVTESGTIFSTRVHSVQKKRSRESDDNLARQSTCLQLTKKARPL